MARGSRPIQASNLSTRVGRLSTASVPGYTAPAEMISFIASEMFMGSGVRSDRGAMIINQDEALG